MKALIASGGRGTRLRPITHTQNKHLIPVANKPIIHYAIETVAEAGIRDIGIVYNGDSREVPDFLGDGSRWGLKFTYIAQNRPGGLAEVVALSEEFIAHEPFIFYLGDNMVVGGVRRFVEEFQKGRYNCFLTIARVADPQRFGVPTIRDGTIVAVTEKPASPASPFAVAGIYLYDHSIFEAVKAIRPSARGELEISDAHQVLIERGYAIGYSEITGWWKDTGKPADLLEANRLVLGQMRTRLEGVVDGASAIEGNVVVEPGAVVRSSKIRGPVIIGAGCAITGSYIGPYTAIGEKTIVTNSEIEYSIVLKECRIVDIRTRIEGSILGNDVEIVEGQTKPRVHRFMIGDQSRIEVV
jgi:glucose-1-phosphate thymidylyltransferase